MALASDRSRGIPCDFVRTRKANDGRNKSKKELASFQKSVKAGVQKELASMDKKRKATKGDIELHAFDAELKDFNYEDMDDLKIDSDDEGSESSRCFLCC